MMPRRSDKSAADAERAAIIAGICFWLAAILCFFIAIVATP